MRFAPSVLKMFPLAAVAFFGIALPAAPTRAQEVGAVRIGVVNPSVVISQLRETHDLHKKLEDDAQALENERKQREADVEVLHKDRDQYKYDAPGYASKNKDYIEKAVAYRAWAEMMQMDLARKQKADLKNLFDKIEAATREVAIQKRLDLVLTEQKPEIPKDLSGLDPNALRNLLSIRNVLYKGDRVDITDFVIANLDGKYGNGTSRSVRLTATRKRPARPIPLARV